jgi:DNA-binding winged helix-turn-helix (wHTH) protein
MEFRWADFRLDLDGRTLERGGESVRVGARAFDLLALLLRNRGRLVSDAFLRRELWPGVSVSDAALRQVLRETRRVLGDDGRRQSVIETVRGHGVRWLAAVASDGRGDAPFVGRDDVIAALERELAEVATRNGSLTLISGRPGIGKTSTLVEIAARAEARGFLALRGWGRAGAEADAYALWADVAEALDAAALTAASGELPASSGISESNRFARFRSLEQAIRRRARERPLLLAFDDLQFADRESLALLRFLAPALRGTRAGIVGTHRPLAAGDERTRDLAALAADGATRTIELRGLHALELRELVISHLHGSLGEDAAAALAQQTEGSPLLALEVARALRASGAALAAASAYQIAESVAVGLQPLLARRLGALPSIARRLLEAAATLGDPVDSELARAVADCSRPELEVALAEAERNALIERLSEDSWRFAHPLFAEVVASQLASRGAAPEVHARIFQALEASGEADPFRVATHALGAGRRVEPAVAVARLRRAAKAAWRIHALGDAETWLRHAVEVAETASLPPLELCDLFQELGEISLGASGLIAARIAFERAARLARDAGDAVRLSRAALGYAHRGFLLAVTGPVLDWLRAAHENPSGHPLLEARVATRFGVELRVSSRANEAEAERLMLTGLERARRVGDALTLGRVLCDASIASLTAADSRAELVAAHEIASCGRQAGDAEIEFRGLAGIATAYLECGDRVGLETAFAACESFVARYPIPYARAVTRGIAAMIALLDGRLDAAEAATAESEHHVRSSGSAGLLMIVGLQRFEVARERGDLHSVLPLIDRSRLHFPQQIGLAALAGVDHALVGDTEIARAAADLVFEKLDTVPNDRNRLRLLVLAAELAYLTGTRPLAAALEPQLAPFAGIHAVTGSAAAYFGSVTQALGFVAAAQDRRSEAAQHFERALLAHEALQSPIWQKRSADALAKLGARRAGS